MSFNPALFTATNKPIGLTGTPVDARTYYYDTTYFVFRAYVDTAEVLAYLIGNNRTGQFSIIINTGGTLVNGVITGGTNAEWWFKDGILDGDLVLKGISGNFVPEQTPEDTGTVLAFSADTVYGSVATPETGNITADLTGALLGVSVLVIHNNGSPPTFGTEFHQLSGSGSYVTGDTNFIDCQYLDDTLIRYSISQ